MEYSRNRVLIFIILAYAILWQVNIVAPLVIFLLGEGVLFRIFLHLAGFGPFIAALILIKRDKDYQLNETYIYKLKNFKVDPKWYIVAVGIPTITYLILRIVQIYFGNESSVFETGLFSLGFPLFISISLSGIKEEPGWRGYLLPSLTDRFSIINSSIIVGILWAFWHFPLYIFGSRPIGQFPQFIFTLVSLSFIYSWLYIQTESIPIVSIFHISHNFSVFMLLDLDRKITFWNGGGVVYAIIAGLIIFSYGPTMNDFRFGKQVTNILENEPTEIIIDN